MPIVNFDRSLIGCKDKCTPNEKVCLGCGRTVTQRLEWPEYTDNEKRRIIELINRGGK